MPTKSAKKAKSTRKHKGNSEANNMKKLKKLPGYFNLQNKKFVVLLVVVLGAAIFGSYKVYTSKAASSGTLDTVNECKYGGVGSKSVVLKVGSTGSCVRVVQTVLNGELIAVPNSRPYWGGLTVDGSYGPLTKEAVTGAQRYWNAYHANVSVDGVVGPQTWAILDTFCRDMRNAHITPRVCEPS